MASSSGTSEIVELKEDRNFTHQSKGIHHSRPHEKGSKLPVLKQGSSSLEDDINKLFINIRNSASGPSRKDTLKKPMRASVSSASGIGFSEPVSLKQALRGLCISQASEMAAMKRLSKPPGSPALSDSGKLTNNLRSLVFDSCKESRAEISLVPEESTSSSTNSTNHSVHSSPRFVFETTSSRFGSTLRQKEVVPSSKQVANRLPTVDTGEKEQKKLGPSQHFHSTSNNVLDLEKNNIPSVPLKQENKCGKSSSSPIKLGNKAGPKIRRRGKLLHIPSSNPARSNKNPPPTFKPVVRNKNVVKKKTKKDLSSIPGISDTYNEIIGNSVPVTSELVCQRCQCSLKNESSKDSPTPSPPPPCTSNEIGSKKNGLNNSIVVNAKTVSKSRDKGEFSQSSKSSSGMEYSSSTSISEDSTMSGSSFGSRPHMSKDLRWEAIQNLMKRHGFLGLGHFNLLKKLGCGDIGTVYLAELNGTNCLFAIKVMDIEFLGRRNKMPRAQTEREILRILDHPFLPTLFAQFVSDNLSCLVMEFCPGGDLHVLRQKQPERYFPEQAARFYVAEVLLALEYLHMLGIVYRDLKPENILVREDGHIMLTDFDLSLRCSVNPTLIKSTSSNLDTPRMSGPCAGSNCIDPFCIKPTCQVSCFSPRLLPTKTRKLKLKADLAAAHLRSLPQLVAEPTDARSNSFVGTHEYLAPEIIKGEGHGSAVDWWTFGVFLYELLYGKTPFKGEGNEETLVNVVLESLKFPDYPIVSFHARDLIRGLLVKEPENRLGSERGAAEIKQHPFFDGLNWALIRCETPPEIPDMYDIGIPKMADQEKNRTYLDCGNSREQLEFELF